MKLKLTTKLTFAFIIVFIISIVAAFVLSFLLYEKMYVQQLREEMLETGQKLAAISEDGKLTDELQTEIDSFSRFSKFDVFAVENPRELSMCLPFEMDYQTLIDGEERQQLLAGNPVYQKGYIERLDREVVSVSIPLLQERRLTGIIYIYYPLAHMSELTLHYTLYWLVGAFFLLLLAIVLGTKWIRSMTKPLNELNQAAEEMANGNLTYRVTYNRNDEIGQVASTFNKMASSIQKEDEERKEFLANVSHELRTPLSYIMGYMEAINSGIIPQERAQDYQQLILREAKRMENLINDLLDLAKLDSPELTMRKSPISLAQTIEDVIERTIIKMEKKNIKYKMAMDYDLIVFADDHRLTQVFLNVLDNAICYTDRNGLITIETAKHSKHIGKITIKDNGRGISASDLPYISDRFYRVDKARTRKDGGTGLGLSIVSKLVDLHGGRLKIYSEETKGTTVEIYLPLIDDRQ